MWWTLGALGIRGGELDFTTEVYPGASPNLESFLLGPRLSAETGQAQILVFLELCLWCSFLTFISTQPCQPYLEGNSAALTKGATYESKTTDPPRPQPCCKEGQRAHSTSTIDCKRPTSRNMRGRELIVWHRPRSYQLLSKPKIKPPLRQNQTKLNNQQRALVRFGLSAADRYSAAQSGNWWPERPTWCPLTNREATDLNWAAGCVNAVQPCSLGERQPSLAAKQWRLPSHKQGYLCDPFFVWHGFLYQQ